MPPRDTPMIEYGSFIGHSGLMLPWKVNCDALTDEDWAGLAQIVRAQFSFSQVMGIPRGGLKFAAALKPYRALKGPLLLVDDVMTTGRSMEEYRARCPFHPTMPTKGVVVFSRGPVPDWIHPIFVVNAWTQPAAVPPEGRGDA